MRRVRASASNNTGRHSPFPLRLDEEEGAERQRLREETPPMRKHIGRRAMAAPERVKRAHRASDRNGA